MQNISSLDLMVNQSLRTVALALIQDLEGKGKTTNDIAKFLGLSVSGYRNKVLGYRHFHSQDVELLERMVAS